jgi:hypothetical protein
MGRVLDRQTVWIYPKTQERNARPSKSSFPPIQANCSGFCSGFKDDSIHFHTTIPNRVEKADSPKTPNLIDDLRRLPEKINGARGGGRTHNLRLRRPTLYPIELRAQSRHGNRAARPAQP